MTDPVVRLEASLNFVEALRKLDKEDGLVALYSALGSWIGTRYLPHQRAAALGHALDRLPLIIQEAARMAAEAERQGATQQ